MKQIKQQFLLTVALLLCSIGIANAEVLSGSCGTNVTYTLDTQTGVLKIEGSGAMTNYSNRGSSRAPWYSYASSIKEVAVSDDVNTIGYYAFSGCSGLTSVTIPNSVTSIGNFAFQYCSGLTSVTIPNSVTSIGSDAFYGCYGLTKAEFASVEALCKIQFPNYYANPLYYANHLYVDGSEVKDLVIPESVVSISTYAFSSISGLTSLVWNAKNCQDFSSSPFPTTVKSVTFGDEVEHIPAYLCNNMSGLTSVIIPGSVTSIGTYAFRYCYGLTKAEFASVEALCKIRFPDCYANPLSYAKHLYVDGSEVKDLVIPESVTSISSYAFYNCSDLTSAIVPNSVTSIGSNAFYGCTNLYEVYNLSNLNIQKGRTTNGYAGYYAKVVHTSRDEPSIYQAVGDFTFVDSETPTLYKYTGNATDLVLPSDFNGKNYEIGDEVFMNHSEITSVTIPNSVTSIGSSAFSGCSGLTSIAIPKSVTSIGKDAFFNCDGMTKAEFASIEDLCKIDFAEYTSNPLRLARHIYVDGKEVTDVVIPESVTKIKNFTFYNCIYLTSISIPNSVKTIGERSFQSCTKVESIVIPNSVTSIGYSAFYDTRFISIQLGKNVASLGGSQFTRDRNTISKNLVCLSVTPPASDSEFCNSEIYANTQLLVPEESIELYKTADYWKKFQNIKGFTGEPFVKGDADGDGMVTKADANMVVEHYIGKDTDIEPLAADVNDDARVTMQDANAILNMVLNKSDDEGSNEDSQEGSNEDSQESAYEGAYSSKKIYTYQTASDYDGFSTMSYSDGAKIQLVGNVEKSFLNGSTITIDGNICTTTKVSNAAQNLFIAPEGMYVVGVNIYSYVNKVARTDRPAYWKEINGAYYSLDGEPILVDDVEIQTTKTTEMNSFSSNRDTPDMRSYTLPSVKEFTFTNTGEQLCFVMEVLYK